MNSKVGSRRKEALRLCLHLHCVRRKLHLAIYSGRPTPRCESARRVSISCWLRCVLAPQIHRTPPARNPTPSSEPSPNRGRRCSAAVRRRAAGERAGIRGSGGTATAACRCRCRCRWEISAAAASAAVVLMERAVCSGRRAGRQRERRRCVSRLPRASPRPPARLPFAPHGRLCAAAREALDAGLGRTAGTPSLPPPSLAPTLWPRPQD